jgi:hypothetical protein
MELSIDNVVNISVAQAQAGAGQYNTSNLAIFTAEPFAVSFGTDDYKLYLSPSDVATDFGTDSKTYKQALGIFSQQPNILAGRGYLAVIPMIVEVQHLAFSGTAASGTFKLNFGGDITAAINWNDTAAQIQTKVRTLTGLEQAVVTGSIAAGLDISFDGYYGSAALLTVSDDNLATSAPVAITITVTETTDGETLGEAIARSEDIVQYFGIVASHMIGESDGLAAAAVVQTLNKILFLVSATEADVEEDGYLDLLRQGSLYKTRGLYYGGTDLEALVMQASYAGRALSVNFSGSNTTITMHLKDLSGVIPDPSMTQTLLQKCEDAGVDVYVSLQGVSKVFCSGANQFFDQVYNLLWFVGALQIAGFNYLAQSSTKIPQTEAGMDGLKGAYRAVCEQGIVNQYGAPGSWNSPTTFGVLSDFLANIAQRGYYIYSLPISQQLQADREDRIAPLVSIAFKEAGAIHSSSVIVNINA